MGTRWNHLGVGEDGNRNTNKGREQNVSKLHVKSSFTKGSTRIGWAQSFK
jgi:hypothetical protein